MKISDWLAREWARQIGPVLSSMTGEAVQAEAPGGSGEPPGEEMLRIVRRLREAPEAVVEIAVGQELWQTGGKAVLRGADLSAEEESEIRGAFLEVVEQSLGQLAASLGRRLGREVSWEEAEIGSLSAGTDGWAEVEVAAGDDRWGKAWVAASPGFVAADESEPSMPASTSETAIPPTQSRRPMLDLLMEVELPVSVTFGRTQMRLKDAVKLTSGSIVELNRSIIEPVEVIVNNCVIARGEVVVVEGNYGVRIQEIVSREERLRTLF